VEFSKIIDTNAVLTTNAWLEGPVWVPSGGGYLVFCDQNNNRLKKLYSSTAPQWHFQSAECGAKTRLRFAPALSKPLSAGLLCAADTNTASNR
jgi:sugar lactone lactonase YvrE